MLPDCVQLVQLEAVALKNRIPLTHEILALVTRQSGCSCGLYFDPAELKSDFEQDRRQASRKMVNRYRRRGWSEAKIKRALQDSGYSRGARSQFQANAAISEQQQIESALQEFAGSSPGGLFILVHSYTGNLGEEVFSIRSDRRNLATLRLNPELLPEDTLIIYYQ
jgi:hypothetical protein